MCYCSSGTQYLPEFAGVGEASELSLSQVMSFQLLLCQLSPQELLCQLLLPPQLHLSNLLPAGLLQLSFPGLLLQLLKASAAQAAVLALVGVVHAGELGLTRNLTFTEGTG